MNLDYLLEILDLEYGEKCPECGLSAIPPYSGLKKCLLCDPTGGKSLHELPIFNQYEIT